MKDYYVYILANERPTLYIGVTNDLNRRLFEHKHSLMEGFSSRYGLDKLVYYEVTNDIESAIHREKRLKHRNRQWKLDLIQAVNPNFDDLSLSFSGLTRESDPPIKSEDDKKTRMFTNVS